MRSCTLATMAHHFQRFFLLLRTVLLLRGRPVRMIRIVCKKFVVTDSDWFTLSLSDCPLCKTPAFWMNCKSFPTSVFFFQFYSFLLVPLKTCYQASHLSSSLKRGFSGLSLLPLRLSYSCERTNLSRGSISLFFRFVISHWLCPLSPVWQTNKKQRERPPWKKLENL